MKLSTKSRYALRSMIDIASKDGLISVSEISKLEDISERYLELIFSSLRSANFIRSVRGSHGGYILSKDPKDISVYDILKTMENDVCIVKSQKQEDPIKQMLQNEIWDPIDENLTSYLKGISLKSLL